MELRLERIAKKSEYTIGKLYINDVYFADTLEDVVRNQDVKVHGKTAIPFGTYKIIMNMSNRFKRILPLLLNVPHFEGIRIHEGNSASDSSGCILVGKNTLKGKLTNSKIWCSILFNLMLEAIDKGEEIRITII